MNSKSAAAVFLLFAVSLQAQVSVLTNRYDNNRTSTNLNEKILNTSNVNPAQFGKLYSYPVSGAVFAQPLYVPVVTIPGKGVHNVLYIATMNDVVYAFDADSTSPTALWTRDFTNAAAGITAVPITDITGNNNLNIINNVGILSTPVIDPTTNTIYMVARTKENGAYLQRLHALDITTGAEKFGGPVVIHGSVPGRAADAVTGMLQFNPKMQNQRTSLALANGVVMIAWGSHEDIDPWHGWVMGYNAATLTQVGVFCTSPNTRWSGIWQGGRAPVVDPSGFVYYQTGNGPWDGITEFGDSILKLQVSTSGITLADWFTPSDWQSLLNYDEDLASSGAMLIPGTTTLVGGGKESVLYLTSTGAMGHEWPTDGQITQLLRVNGGEMKGGPAYWRSTAVGPLIFDWPQSDAMRSWHYNGTTIDTQIAQTSAYSPGSPGGTLAVSANGSDDNTGIVWAQLSSSIDDDHGLAAGIVRAFRATNLQELWNSEQNPGRDRLGTLVKFVAPLVVNGKMYAVTYDNAVNVYGLLNPPDFTLAASPTSGAIAQGGTATFGLTTTALNGFAGSVTFSTGTLPNGISANFLSNSVQFTAAANAATGTFPLTITGISGTLSHAVQVSLTVTPGAKYANGYNHRRFVVINHNSVPNTEQTGFPLYFTITDPAFKTAANGGHVSSAAGYDIVFSTSASGAGGLLSHQIGQYNAATGTFKAWVNIPTLSHIVDTTLYVFYGNPGIATSQENVAGVWDANYVSISHLPAAAGTPGSGVTPAGGGQVGIGSSFDGSANAYIDLGTSSAFDIPGAFTISAWFKKSGYRGGYEVLASKCSTTACNYEFALDATNRDLEGVQNGTVLESGSVPSLNQWHYGVQVSTGTSLLFYLDGALVRSVIGGTGAIVAGTHFSLGSELPSGENFLGILDEARLSKTARSADWILAEFRNQSTPSSFFVVGAEDATTPPTSGSGYPNGYAHRRTVTVSHLNVSNTDQAGFPMLFSITDPLFRSVPNGGNVTSTNGYDIIFSTDPNGAAGSALSHEIGQYNAATGTFKAWVNLPTLSHSADTTVYVFYGNSAVTTSQENRASVWDSNFVSINHLPSTTGTAGAGVTSAGGAQVGIGSSFDGSNNAYIDLGTASIFDLPAAFTVSTWFKKTSYTGGYEVLVSKCNASACNYELALDGPNHDLEGVQNGTVLETGVVPSLNQWHHVVETSTGGQLSFYLDGALVKTTTGGTGATLAGTHLNIGREQAAGENFSGFLDELRLSKTARSANWIATEYRNQVNPAAFYTVSAEQ